MPLRRYLVERRAGSSRRGRCDACQRSPHEVGTGDGFFRISIGADPGRKDVVLCEPCWSSVRTSSDGLDRGEDVTSVDVCKVVY